MLSTVTFTPLLVYSAIVQDLLDKGDGGPDSPDQPGQFHDFHEYGSGQFICMHDTIFVITVILLSTTLAGLMSRHLISAIWISGISKRSWAFSELLKKYSRRLFLSVAPGPSYRPNVISLSSWIQWRVLVSPQASCLVSYKSPGDWSDAGRALTSLRPRTSLPQCQSAGSNLPWATIRSLVPLFTSWAFPSSAI